MDATQDAIDYLGRRQPIGQQALGALPSDDSGFGGVVAPPVTGPGAGPGGAPGLGTIARSPVLTPQSQSALALAARALGTADRGWGWLRSLFGQGGPDTGAGLGAEASAGGADQLASSAGAGSSFGAEVAPSWGALGASMQAAAPIWAGLTAVVDLLGPHTFPFEGLLNSIFGFDDPSSSWLNFGGNVRNTLTDIEARNAGLAGALLTGTTDAELQSALGSWRTDVGRLVPGWGKDAGAWDLPDLPGAGGTAHEWKTEWDFAPELLGLRAELAAARAGKPAAERQSAFLDAAKAWQTEQAAKRAQREADAREWERAYDPGTGAP
jgi:hypothetical protein